MANALFLTAYDPLDVPGGSIDPLGFLGGYLALADEFLPGLTGAASQPTYLAVLCGGLRLADNHLGRRLDSLSATRRRGERVDIAMRFERAWALACVLVSAEADAEGAEEAEAGEDAPVLAGLRGVTYVRAELERINRHSARNVGTRYPLLARQYTYGMMGIYGTVAEQLRLLDKPDFTLTPSLGCELGDGFLEETLSGDLKAAITKLAVSDDARVPLDKLREWGGRAFVGKPLTGHLSSLMRDALVASSRRAASLELLDSGVEGVGDESDVDIIGACLSRLRLATKPEDAGSRALDAVMSAILEYESTFRWASAGFERLLWLVRQSGDACPISIAENDEVILRACEALSKTAPRILEAHSRLLDLGLTAAADGTRNPVQFAHSLADCDSGSALVTRLTQRHRDVQQGKLDRGRPKLPWIEQRGDMLAITSSRAGGRDAEVTRDLDIPTHDWRTYSARNLLRSVGGLS